MYQKSINDPTNKPNYQTNDLTILKSLHNFFELFPIRVFTIIITIFTIQINRTFQKIQFLKITFL